jgi:hypothetical protein
MKKIAYIFLLLSLLFNMGGYFWTVRLLHKQIRGEVRAHIKTLKENDLCVFNWEKIKKNPQQKVIFLKNEEIFWNGKLYDIVRKDMNKQIFWLFEDIREQTFLRQIIGKKWQEWEIFWHSVFQLLIKEALISQKIIFQKYYHIFFATNRPEKLIVFFPEPCFFSSPVLELLSPPPEIKI